MMAHSGSRHIPMDTLPLRLWFSLPRNPQKMMSLHYFQWSLLISIFIFHTGISFQTDPRVCCRPEFRVQFANRFIHRDVTSSGWHREISTRSCQQITRCPPLIGFLRSSLNVIQDIVLSTMFISWSPHITLVDESDPLRIWDEWSRSP